MAGARRLRAEGGSITHARAEGGSTTPADGTEGGSTTPAGGRTGREGAAAAAQRGELSNFHVDPLTSRTVSIPVTVTVTAFSLPRPPNCLPSADPVPRGVPALFGYELSCGGTLHTDMYEERL
ncbi:hypothetical protein J1605_005840 [Eschrichtius robustus]|uniref:Uncharacterized protein n=1 Tax=Eschrichtius robustus TaxID=9764 RepID=A0AB34H6F0_ESCRO|nr:hypothetical protein J1605_005840 [Eschrichtius robustus]